MPHARTYVDPGDGPCAGGQAQPRVLVQQHGLLLLLVVLFLVLPARRPPPLLLGPVPPCRPPAAVLPPPSPAAAEAEVPVVGEAGREAVLTLQPLHLQTTSRSHTTMTPVNPPSGLPALLACLLALAQSVRPCSLPYLPPYLIRDPCGGLWRGLQQQRLLACLLPGQRALLVHGPPHLHGQTAAAPERRPAAMPSPPSPSEGGLPPSCPVSASATPPTCVAGGGSGSSGRSSATPTAPAAGSSRQQPSAGLLLLRWSCTLPLLSRLLPGTYYLPGS